MRAVVISSGRLLVEDRPDPVPASGELLVRVRAAGVNGADLLQRKGRYPPPTGIAPDMPGLEMAGVVEAVGPGTKRYREGDGVMGIVGGGGQAELCVIPEVCAIAVPESLDWPAAGGFPEVFTTAHDALFTQCGLSRGERVLVTGAAGGVGVASVQLAGRAGATVVASVRHPGLRDLMAGLGADAVVSPDEEERSGPYDVVIELVGIAALGTHLQALSTGGRVVVIGLTGTGAKAELDAGLLMSKRALVRGSTLRARSVEEKGETARALSRDALSLLASGDIVVPVAQRFPLDRAEEAYDRFAEGGKLGKIVLEVGS